jgi:hypothetical protein
MKNLLLLLVSLLMFCVSCSKPIDKKIVLTEYGKTIEEIKKDHKEYTVEDFTTANRNLDSYGFKAMSDGNMNSDVTYKELLDKAKFENSENKKIEDEYQIKVKNLRKVLNIKVLSGKYKALDEIAMDGYLMDIYVSNSAKKRISGAKGKMFIYDIKDVFLAEVSMDFDEGVPASFEAEAEVTNILFDGANVSELKALPSNSLRFVWYPSKIIFDDGETLEAIK